MNYLLFVFNDEGEGGWSGFRGAFETVEEAIAVCKKWNMKHYD